MAGSIDYFVSDATGSRGPLSSDAVRAALEAAGDDARVRVEGCEPWLPAEAWEAFADLRGNASAPAMPASAASTKLPDDLAAVAPRVRELLLWFVADADGVMGPVTGEYVRKGLLTSKIRPDAGVCLVSTQSWVRASIAFASALEGATAVRPRVVAPPCPACLEPCIPGEPTCTACGEAIVPPPQPLGRRAIVIVVALAWVIVAAAAAAAGFLVATMRAR